MSELPFVAIEELLVEGAGTRDRGSGSSPWSLAPDPCPLFHSHPIVPIPSRDVRDDDFVAFLEALHNLDGAHRGATKLHLHPGGFLATGLELEQRHRTARLAKRGPAHR